MGGELPHVSMEVPISTLMEVSGQIGRLQGTVESIQLSQQDIFEKLDAIQAQPHCLDHAKTMKNIEKGHSKIHNLEINGAVNNVRLALIVGIFSSAITILVMAVVQRFLT